VHGLTDRADSGRDGDTAVVFTENPYVAQGGFACAMRAESLSNALGSAQKT